MLWKVRWNLLRLGLAGLVLWVLAADSGARLARLQLAALPGFDYAAEVRALAARGRYGEAELIAQAGLQDPDADHGAIDGALVSARAEQSSWLRRVKEAGRGVMTGRGDSLESLIGALTTDLFVVGDVRDLVIEGSRLVIDGETDELVVLLSVAGIVTTLAPEVDWAPSIVKAARRAGLLSEGLTSHFRTTIKSADAGELRKGFGLVRDLARATSPGFAARVLRWAESPADLALVARFLKRGNSAASALHVTEKTGMDLLRHAGPDAFESAAELVTKAGRKGRAGARFLSSPSAKRLLRPHPLLGLTKGLVKGNVQQGIARFAEGMDPLGWWLTPAAAAWALMEAWWLLYRANRERVHNRGRGAIT
jgi:hypothetical protein